MEHTTSTRHQQCARTGSWVVRDDRDGTLTAALTSEIERAHELRERAELAEHALALEGWRAEFLTWRGQCGETLRTGFGADAAREFSVGTTTKAISAERWREGRTEAIKTLEDMIQLLTMLRHTLVGQGRGAQGRCA